MTEPLKKLVSGIQTFGEIIEKDLLYVDKTSYLADMISETGTKVWFLSRPRRFGKSLTVSTLEAVFEKPDPEREKPLFKGLAIESRLGEAAFAPRPVIRLDMTAVTTNMGAEEVEFSLRRYVARLARKLGFDLVPDIPSGEMFQDLIGALALKSGKVAVLIDEYDSPLTSFFGKPAAVETVRDTMRNFFSKLKSMDEHISFVFITGVCKFSRMGVFSTLNNFTYISLDPEFGSMMGYTHEEFAARFAGHAKAAAAELKMDEKEFLEKTRSYYYGFCFDGRTRVYNPYSTVRWLSLKYRVMKREEPVSNQKFRNFFLFKN